MQLLVDGSVQYLWMEITSLWFLDWELLLFQDSYLRFRLNSHFSHFWVGYAGCWRFLFEFYLFLIAHFHHQVFPLYFPLLPYLYFILFFLFFDCFDFEILDGFWTPKIIGFRWFLSLLLGYFSSFRLTIRWIIRIFNIGYLRICMELIHNLVYFLLHFLKCFFFFSLLCGFFFWNNFWDFIPKK